MKRNAALHQVNSLLRNEKVVDSFARHVILDCVRQSQLSNEHTSVIAQERETGDQNKHASASSKFQNTAAHNFRSPNQLSLEFGVAFAISCKHSFGYECKSKWKQFVLHRAPRIRRNGCTSLTIKDARWEQRKSVSEMSGVIFETNPSQEDHRAPA